ncbi:hypothetical protein ACFFTM_16460 [Pseudoduganella plicata]|uniref:Twin-arginine translocation pathway signal protein n=1 Tax=Pseudoduganella plicata TaxID=321984 RepID=A0A4P7BMX7_9BURK|nr:hypothetical protein [Pseudoduganella plicata]QBQ39009.1 hypothetical protein E1742_24820 [Pseudoduganella plicata]GGY86460.1 hypothetical protein GCM10007388_19630 [Pseudoduganella plicata]
MTTRRAFLRFGMGGAIALAAGGAFYRGLQQGAPRRFNLDAAGHEFLTAIVPVLLGPALPASADVAPVVGRVRAAIAGLPLAAQAELQDLFGLLALAPARRLLTGLPAWRDASPARLHAFLQDWRLHRFLQLRAAYQALHDLVIGSWYADPASWAAIGYPGPTKALA